jgi:serine O-acetyltransferase
MKEIREKRNPGLAMKFYIVERWFYTRGFYFLSMLVCRTLQIVCGCIIRPTTQIGEGTVFPHSVGIVIHQNTKIGSRCKIYQNVTIGNGNGPIIGDDCVIGAGACILGDIVIGNRCRIGANAVVLKSLPDDVTAVGVPARIVRDRRQDKFSEENIKSI